MWVCLLSFPLLGVTGAIAGPASASGTEATEWDARFDFNEDGVVDDKDLLLFIMQWQTRAPGTGTPTATPTPTPTPTTGLERTLRLPSVVPVEMQEVFPGCGAFSGSATMTVELSNVINLT